MLFIKELKPTLNTQSDSIRAVIFIAEIFYIFFCKSLCYCYLVFFIFYHLPFVTISTYFIAFHILTCNFTSYMQSFSFFLYLKMISARSKRRKILSLVFFLKCVSKKPLIPCKILKQQFPYNF